MTRVDFYLLPPQGNAVGTACLLCEKAVASGRRIYVRALEAALADELDGALWSFKQGGFIAHERWSGPDEPEQPPPPVLIGGGEPPDAWRGVVLNLGEDVPPWFSSCERVLEVVPADDHARARLRERFRWYKDRGYPLTTYEQGAEGGWKQRA